MPTRTELLEASRDMDEENRRHCVQSQDRLWYTVRTGRLFHTEKPLRESVLYWFHVLRYGSHAGVTKNGSSDGEMGVLAPDETSCGILHPRLSALPAKWGSEDAVSCGMSYRDQLHVS